MQTKLVKFCLNNGTGVWIEQVGPLPSAPLAPPCRPSTPPPSKGDAKGPTILLLGTGCGLEAAAGIAGISAGGKGRAWNRAGPEAREEGQAHLAPAHLPSGETCLSVRACTY